MTIRINLQAPEHLQLTLLSDGVQELNRVMVGAGGSPAVLVSKEGSLCAPDGEGNLVDITVDAMAALLRSVCVPGKPRRNEDDPEEALFVEEPCLPRSLVKAYMETQHWPGLPRVKQVARAPIVRPDFTIRWEPGWDEKTACWVLRGLAADRRLVDRKYDIREIFDQFPFVDPRLVADSLAAALTPLLSTAIDGALPGFIVTARKPGSGKTELAKFCSIIGNGGKMFTTWKGSNELEKTIGTYVAEDRRVVIFDNIKNDIDSTAMESVITARTVSFRKMYSHRSVSLRSSTAWFMTANGAIVSSDMVRRSIVVMLDKDAHNRDWDGTWPWKVEKAEAALITLMCEMIEDWRKAGCVRGSVNFSNFEEWSGIVSGILECAGIAGMWEAREEVVGDAIQTDDEDDMPILEAIAAVMGGEEWTSGQLWETVNDPMSDLYGGASAALVREWLKSVGRVSRAGSKPSIPTGRALHNLDGKTFQGCNIILDSRIGGGRRKFYRCKSLDGTAIPEPEHKGISGFGDM